MTEKTADRPAEKPFEFEKALAELEKITDWFESNDAGLDQGLDKFERGMELASQLKAHLATVENRVEKIKQRFSSDSATPGPSSSPVPDSSEQSGLFGA